MRSIFTIILALFITVAGFGTVQADMFDGPINSPWVKSSGEVPQWHKLLKDINGKVTRFDVVIISESMVTFIVRKQCNGDSNKPTSVDIYPNGHAVGFASTCDGSITVDNSIAFWLRRIGELPPEVSANLQRNN